MKTLSILAITALVAGMFFISMPVEGQAINTCCQVSQSACFDNDGGGPLPTTCFGELFPNSICSDETEQCVSVARNVPALSAIGSIVIAGLLAIVAIVILHRRRKATI